MSAQDQWTAVDRYFTDLLLPPDPALDAALRASAAAGLPAINVSPNQGKLLHAARPVAAAPADPRDRHARRLQHDLARPRAAAGTPAAGSSRWRTAASTPTSPAPTSPAPGWPTSSTSASAPAIDTLPQIANAAKAAARSTSSSSTPTRPNTADYFAWVAEARPAAARDRRRQRRPQGRGDRRRQRGRQRPGRAPLHRRARRRAARDATAIQTVGSKGYDGFAMAVVTG